MIYIEAISKKDMKTFIDQIIDDGRSINDLDEFINEFGMNPMERYIGEAIGITDEENEIWSPILTNKGYSAAIEALKPIIEQRKQEREEINNIIDLDIDKSAKVKSKIKQARLAIDRSIKILNKE